MTIRKAVALIGLTLTLVGTDVATAFAATAPFAIFNDNGGDRDRFQHLLFLAEHGRDARDRGRKYRNLGAVLSKAGRGKEALRAYYAQGMEEYPHFRFQLHRVGVGVDSLALNYIGVDGALANEVHVLNSDGKAIDVRIHYSAAL